MLIGGSGDDILIAGPTIHDADLAHGEKTEREALRAILAVWESPLGYEERVEARVRSR